MSIQLFSRSSQAFHKKNKTVRVFYILRTEDLSRCSSPQIGLYQHLKQLVSVDVTNKASCVVVCSYISRILGQDIAHDLIYGIIALFP